MRQIHLRGTYLLALPTALLVTLLLAACAAAPVWAPPTVAAPQPTETPAPPQATATATQIPASPTATRIPPSPTSVPTAGPTPSVDALVASLQAKLPPKAFEGLKALPLTVPIGTRPLVAVYSYGMHNYDLKPLPNHFVAIYGQEGSAWKEITRKELSYDDDTVAAPDYVGKGDLTQAVIEPGHIWLALSGGAGAHGGVFDLLSFDGTNLRVEVRGVAASPGSGRIQDVNGDGTPDIVLDVSDRYVFCYACGVSKIMFDVYAWDKPNNHMIQRELQPMLMGQSGHPARALTNEAVSLAEAGLWKDAMAKITEAEKAAANVKPPLTNETVDWDYGLIKLHADAMAKAIATKGGYPLVSNVFYGDYGAAVDLMRAYSPAQIFSARTPLLVGTVAETWVPQLTGYITESVNSALNLRPDLASAYFLRGWALYLAAPTKNAVLYKADVAQAAALAPADALFSKAAQYFGGSSSPTATPTTKATPVVTATPTAKATPIVKATPIQFAAGATSANVEGHVAAGDIARYVLRALKGQWTQVNVYAPKDDLALEIYGLTDGQPLVRSQMKRTSWAGVLPATQDYSISVFSFGGNETYTLQVIIPERITFASGAVSATAQGNLASHQTHDYLLRAMAGQTMTVTITSPSSDVLLEIYGIEDGQPLVRVPMGVTTWTGKLPGTQDYAIKAVSVGNSTNYKIQFVVK